MTAKEYQQADVCEAWANSHGDASTPFGGGMRRYFFNPFVHGIASGERPALQGVVQWLVENSHEPNARALLDWHTTVLGRKGGLAGTRVLDLGCGEAYLGRWLSPQGADYLGVDSSAGMIRIARQRSSNQLGLRLLVIDLESEDDLRALRLQIGSSAPPTLAVAAIILDHLKCPTDLLKTLGKVLGRFSTSILVWTLHPGFYRLGDLAEEKYHRLTVRSAGVSVHCWMRTSRWYEGLFAKCGFSILDHCAPTLPTSFVPHAVTDEFDYKAPPFNIWHLRPLAEPPSIAT